MTIFSLAAGAQSVDLKKSLTGVGKPAGKAWILPMTMETGSTTHQEWSHERESYTTIAVSPQYRITPRLRIAGSTSFSKSHSGAGDANFDNSAVSVSFLTPFNERFTWSVGGGAVLPTNPQLREETTYNGALRVNTGITVTEIYRGSLLNYRMTFGRNFHEYSQDSGGNYNLRESFGQSLDYTQPLGAAFSATVVLGYTSAWTYLNDERYNFLAAFDLSFQAAQRLSVSVGTANQGSALRPNGRDSNIRFFNDETSIIKLGLTYVL